MSRIVAASHFDFICAQEIGDIAVPENAMATKVDSSKCANCVRVQRLIFVLPLVGVMQAFHQFKQVYDELEVAHKSGKMPVTDLWLVRRNVTLFDDMCTHRLDTIQRPSTGRLLVPVRDCKNWVTL